MAKWETVGHPKPDPGMQTVFDVHGARLSAPGADTPSRRVAMGSGRASSAPPLRAYAPRKASGRASSAFQPFDGARPGLGGHRNIFGEDVYHIDHGD